jgi:hypothetical protein
MGLRYLGLMNQPRQRARSPHDKQLRKTALLNAARELAIEQGVRQVTLAAVTARIGLHDWRDRLVAGLADGRGLAAGQIAAVVSGSLEQLPLFCDLLTHVVLSLEGAVRLERARRYKTAASAAYDSMTEALIGADAGLGRQGAQVLLTAAMSCAAYLFQLSRPTATLRQLYTEEPRWAHNALRFREQLTTLLTAVTLGARQHGRLPVGD